MRPDRFFCNRFIVVQTKWEKAMTCYPAFLPLFIKKDSRWLKTIIFSSLLFLMIFLISPFSHAIEQFDAQLDQRLRTKAVRGYDKMIQSRFIRALVPHSKTFYFLDGAKIRGASYEMLKKFEMQVNKKLSNPVLKVNIVIIPTPRDRLIPDLVAGYGDIALGNLTITQNRLDKIDFSDPLAKGVSEILITHASAGHIESPYDLSGRDVHVRKSSSYYESLVQLNKKLAGKGKPLGRSGHDSVSCNCARRGAGLRDARPDCSASRRPVKQVNDSLIGSFLALTCKKVLELPSETDML